MWNLQSNRQKLSFTLTMSLATALLLNSFPAIAGSRDAGGGAAVVCRNEAGKITSAEMFDLFEGRALYQLESQAETKGKTYLEIAVSVGIELDRGRSRMPEAEEYSLGYRIREIDKKKQMLPTDAGVSTIDDTLSPILPKNCKAVQAAVYLESGELYLDQEIWTAFDQLNKAALLVHEAVYKELRDMGETNSIRARRAVANAFAGKKFEYYKEGIPVSGSFLCYDDQEQYRFYLYPISKETDRDWNIRIQFETLNGVEVVSKTFFDSTLHSTKYSEVENPHPEISFQTMDNWNFGDWTGTYQKMNSIIDFDAKITIRVGVTASGEPSRQIGTFRGAEPAPGRKYNSFTCAPAILEPTM